MISHILAATDGSDTADRAVDLAAKLATAFDVPLTVGHMLQHGSKVEELSRMADVEHMVRHTATEARIHTADMPSNMDALFSGGLSAADRDRIVAIMGEEIAARAARRAKDAGAQNVSARVANGEYDEGILNLAADVGADMIVIGHRGLGRLESLLQGSVSQKVNQRAKCTVVNVR